MANKKIINSLNYGDTYIFTTPYGVCSTAAGTAAKAVTIENFALETGARITVKFTYTNTVASPTLNVNSTGAKAIYWHGAALPITQYWKAGAALDFVYNGTQWDLIGVADISTLEGLIGDTKVADQIAAAIPDTLKNPNFLTVQGNGTQSFTYDGSDAKTLNIKAGTNVSVSSDTSGNITISSTDTNTDTKVTAVGNHYTPAKSKTISASSTTAATWGSTDMVTGIEVDAAGHVTGVTSIQMPSNPNSDTNTTYDLAASASSTNGNVKLNLTAGGSGDGTDSVSIKGSGATTVTTDSSGVIIISSTDNNTVTTATTSGSGNAVTSVTASNGALTVTKGETFATKAQLDAVSGLVGDTAVATQISDAVSGANAHIIKKDNPHEVSYDQLTSKPFSDTRTYKTVTIYNSSMSFSKQGTLAFAIEKTIPEEDMPADGDEMTVAIAGIELPTFKWEVGAITSYRFSSGEKLGTYYANMLSATVKEGGVIRFFVSYTTGTGTGYMNSSTASVSRTVILKRKKTVSGELIQLDNKYISNHEHLLTEIKDSPIKLGTGSKSIILNSLGTASGTYSVAEGQKSEAIGDYSHAEGYFTKAIGDYSHAEGYYTEADSYSHAEGYRTEASDRSHAEGYYTNATNYSHAEGYHTEASNHSHAEGYYTNATGLYSHAEGDNTLAIGYTSHAEGNIITSQISLVSVTGAAGATTYTITDSSGNSFTEIPSGVMIDDYVSILSTKIKESDIAKVTDITASTITFDKTLSTSALSGKAIYKITGGISSGKSSHAEGSSIASGDYSHAEGKGTIAASSYQHVQGKYNIKDAENDYIHIVGNGEGEGAYSNAHTLDWEGNAWFAGDVTVGADNKKLTTEGHTHAITDVETLDLILEGITVDYVVAQGKTTYWHYRKWNSGKAEIWGSATIQGTEPTTMMGGYYSYGTTPEYPFTFTVVHSIIASAKLGTGIGWSTTSTTVSNGTIYCVGNQNSKSITYSCYVCGTWK